MAGLIEATGNAVPQVRVRFVGQRGTMPSDDALDLFASLREGKLEYLRVLRGADGSFVFRFDNGARFDVAAGGARIVASWPKGITFQDVTAYLLGPVVGFIVRLRGTVCLHASAVLIDGAAVAFLGAGGAGKSSMCAYFAQRGAVVLTDDVLALRLSRGGIRALAGPARLRLWPDAARHLYGAHVVLPRVHPSDPRWEKGYRDHAPGAASAPLAAIYTRGDGESPSPRVSASTGRDAFLRLAANRYPVRLPVPDQSESEFGMLAAVAGEVPLRCIHGRRGIDGLGALHDAIRTDLRQLAGGATRAGSANVRIAG